MNLNPAHLVSFCLPKLTFIQGWAPAVLPNRIQFQHGVLLPEFFTRYGTEDQCTLALTTLRWPVGFRCSGCSSATYYLDCHGYRKRSQCDGCSHQTSLTAGTLADSTKLPLRTWFLVVYLISQDKTGLSSLALKRPISPINRTAPLIHQKLT